MNIHIIGLQETRTPHTGVQLSTHKKNYIVASSSAHNHQFGNELWLSTKLPFGTIKNEDSFLDINQVLILKSDPRLLVVRTIHPLLN